MAKRSLVLATLKYAGYHNDKDSFVRLLVENRISYTVAQKAFAEGITARENGMPCNCSSCK